MRRQMRTLSRPGRGGTVASRERHGACSSRCDRDSRLGAHTCAARCGPSAGLSRGGAGSHRASGTGRARLAAIATRSCGHTHAPPDADPLPVRAGEGRVASRERHGACSSRRDRDSQLGAHTCAARCGPSAGLGREGRVSMRERHGACQSRSDWTSDWGTYVCRQMRFPRRLAWRVLGRALEICLVALLSAWYRGPQRLGCRSRGSRPRLPVPRPQALLGPARRLRLPLLRSLVLRLLPQWGSASMHGGGGSATHGHDRSIQCM